MTHSSLHHSYVTTSVCLLFIGTSLLHGETGLPREARVGGGVTTPEKLAQYVRDRFQVPEGVKLNVEPLHDSRFPVFLQTVVTADDGKEKHPNTVFISKDGRCFVLGNVFALSQGSTDEIIRCIREAAKLPPETQLKIRDFTKSPYPQFLKAIITASDGTRTQTARVFITKDRRTGIVGVVAPFRRDVVRGMIQTKDVPSVGRGTAPVTIVEYADLQCPTCATLHEVLEKELLPKYGDKVRVIFKEFPLPMHDWSTTAAVANECAYLYNPSLFADYRTLIFANQNVMNASNVRERLLSLGNDAGIDSLKLAACIDSKASLPRVEASRQEGEDLAVDRTPTSFVNGRIVVGAQSEADWDKIVDEALRARSD